MENKMLLCGSGSQQLTLTEMKVGLRQIDKQQEVQFHWGANPSKQTRGYELKKTKEEAEQKPTKHTLRDRQVKWCGQA